MRNSGSAGSPSRDVMVLEGYIDGKGCTYLGPRYRMLSASPEEIIAIATEQFAVSGIMPLAEVEGAFAIPGRFLPKGVGGRSTLALDAAAVLATGGALVVNGTPSTCRPAPAETPGEAATAFRLILPLVDAY